MISFEGAAERVLWTLRCHGDGSSEELSFRAGVSPRTVRYALGRLRAQGAVICRLGPGDARCRRYAIAPALPPGGGPANG